MQPSQAIPRYIKIIQSMIPGGVLPDASQISISVQQRRVYQPLMVYCQLISMEESGHRQPELLEGVARLEDGIWPALARQVAGELFNRGDWISQARILFAKLAAQQQPSGEFLPADPHANPETRWYQELTLLHAASNFLIREPTGELEIAVRRSALFHLNETQPDHATAEPWGLPAFIRFAPPLADQVLHAVSMNYPGGVTGPALLLLGDALYGLRRLRAVDNGQAI